MNKPMLAVLSDAERLLVAETEPAASGRLDEDDAVALHDRIRRARTKYVGLYRRGASARVVEQGSRGKARPKNTTAAAKAETFEQALAHSTRLAVPARASAAELRRERLQAARAAGTGQKPAADAVTGSGRKARDVTDAPVGERALRNPATEKRRAATRAAGARRQAKRDSR